MTRSLFSSSSRRSRGQVAERVDDAGGAAHRDEREPEAAAADLDRQRDRARPSAALGDRDRARRASSQSGRSSPSGRPTHRRRPRSPSAPPPCASRAARGRRRRTRKMPSPTASSTCAACSRSAATARAAASAASRRTRSFSRRALRTAAAIWATRPSTSSSCSSEYEPRVGHHLDDADDAALVLDRHHHRGGRPGRLRVGDLLDRPLRCRRCSRRRRPAGRARRRR